MATCDLRLSWLLDHQIVGGPHHLVGAGGADLHFGGGELMEEIGDAPGIITSCGGRLVYSGRRGDNGALAPAGTTVSRETFSSGPVGKPVVTAAEGLFGPPRFPGGFCDNGGPAAAIGSRPAGSAGGLPDEKMK
jgi:hypothetical protein